jgi:NAD(P)H-binding
MANSGEILITGATGKVGSALLDNLGPMNIELRALAHDESEAESLEDRGVEAVLGDYLMPETLGPALAGVSTVFLLTPIHPEQVTQATNVIEAARGSGDYPRIVRLSVHQDQQTTRRDRRQVGLVRTAIYPPASPVVHAEHLDGRPNRRLARQDLPTDEKRQAGDDRRRRSGSEDPDGRWP